MALLLHLNERDEANWAGQLTAALDGYRVVRRGEDYDPAEIRYLFAWKPTEDAFDGLLNLKAVFSLGAGVDGLLQHPRLPRDVPIVRFVDEELSQCMSDYVVAHVTMHQRLFTRFAADQKAKRWDQLYPPAASASTVGIMGLGVLGQDAARRLLALGFPVRGWSRSQKAVEGVETFSGADGLDPFLSGTDILVCLLPLTPETKGILNYRTFSTLRRDGLEGGPVIVNAARGGHQVETDIVTALTDGTLAAASLDVFEIEPLPAESPLWELENCFVTPHIAAISNERTGVAYFAAMLKEHEAGRPLRNVVDLVRGY